MRPLVTNRLRLEPLEPLELRHADLFFVGLRDSRLYNWIDEKPPESVDWLRRRYEKLQMRQSPDGSEVWLNWAIWSLTERRYIGYVQATIRGRRGTVAYLLFVDSQGKGFAREAVGAMIHELICSYNVAEVYATVDRRNRRSCQLLIDLSFKQVMGEKDAVAEVDGNELLFRLDPT